MYSRNRRVISSTRSHVTDNPIPPPFRNPNPKKKKKKKKKEKPKLDDPHLIDGFSRSGFLGRVVYNPPRSLSFSLSLAWAVGEGNSERVGTGLRKPSTRRTETLATSKKKKKKDATCQMDLAQLLWRCGGPFWTSATRVLSCQIVARSLFRCYSVSFYHRERGCLSILGFGTLYPVSSSPVGLFPGVSDSKQDLTAREWNVYSISAVHKSRMMIDVHEWGGLEAWHHF